MHDNLQNVKPLKGNHLKKQWLVYKVTSASCSCVNMFRKYRGIKTKQLLCVFNL